MSSNSQSVQKALHQDATFPGKFNPANGKWETASDRSGTRLAFDPVTKKLVALTPQQVAANAGNKFAAVDMACTGFYPGNTS